jgi:hypothetical protein
MIFRWTLNSRPSQTTVKSEKAPDVNNEYIPSPLRPAIVLLWIVVLLLEEEDSL